MSKVIKINDAAPMLDGGIAAANSFEAVRTATQVGDKFFVPEGKDLVVLGRVSNVVDREGNEVKNADGTNQTRVSGQRFCAVKMIDGKPDSVVELYVGQVVKIDVKGSVVFNNELASALRKSGELFKNAICGKMLEVVGEKDIMDRDWDAEHNRWKRDEEGHLVGRPSVAKEFAPKAAHIDAKVREQIKEMLYDYYQEKYSEQVVVEEE